MVNNFSYPLLAVANDTLRAWATYLRKVAREDVSTDWTEFIPEFDPVASGMTITLNSVASGEYRINNDGTAFLNLECNITLAGVASISLYLNSPFFLGEVAGFSLTGWVDNAGNDIAVLYRTNASQFIIYKRQATAYTLGATTIRFAGLVRMKDGR